MKVKFALPVLVISIVATIAFSVQWLQQRQVQHVTIATGSSDGEYYAFAQALATVVARHQPKIRITVVATKGAQQNQDLLEQKRVELAIVQSDTPPQPSVRAVAYLFPEVFHLIVSKKSGIEKISDLKGRRVALMPKGSGSYNLFWSISPHFGLSERNLTAILLPPDRAYEALLQGKVDAVFRVIAIGNPSISRLLANSQTKLLPIDQVDSLRLSLPILEATQIPIGTYDGATPIPSQDLTAAAVRAVLVTHKQVDSSVVQAITQTLFEFRNEMVTIYPRSALMRLPEAGQNLGIPLHSGAKAYYEQERPNFLMANSEFLGLVTSVSAICVSALWQLRSWLLNNQKDRADMYNLEILELVEQVHSVNDLEQLQSVRHKLFEILRKVVVDLDQDRISPESFQSFTFPWEVAISTVRHREIVLINLRSTLEND
ncbi:MAG: TAXI family TRAP transporter solute-binding subunit [Timaviella obliquedivisa GSE-PSE-MK23-08B]|jgi:TRAP transporter TAXI family solute receptor|nr:TAXI family TRAP transporter solute-binding subunit [Timaviella obliquedivisa GSE-PSE-MK23-08B]